MLVKQFKFKSITCFDEDFKDIKSDYFNVKRPSTKISIFAI